MEEYKHTDIGFAKYLPDTPIQYFSLACVFAPAMIGLMVAADPKITFADVLEDARSIMAPLNQGSQPE